MTYSRLLAAFLVVALTYALPLSAAKITFQAQTDSVGSELFVYDDINDSITQIDINKNTNSSTIAPKAVIDGKSYYLYDHPEYGMELFVYDGSSFELVADIFPGSDDGFSDTSAEIAVIDNKLYFSADDGVHGRELWEYNITTPPNMVADIFSGDQFTSSLPSKLTVVDNKLYFIATDGVHGMELWEYNITTPPNMVADIRNGIYGSYPSYITSVNGKLYFTADDGIYGTELWEYNITALPNMVLDINPSSNSEPKDLKVLNSNLYFSADDGVHGRELWEYNITTPPNIVADIRDGAGGSFSSSSVPFATMNNKLYFSAFDGTHGYELWSYDGTNAPIMVADINLDGSAKPNYLTVLNNKLYFSANDGINGYELWSYDGINSPSIIKDIQSGDGSSAPQNFNVVGNKVVFYADDGTNGGEYWVSDGTETGTTMIKNICSGSCSGGSTSTYEVFSGSDGKFYFTADDGIHGKEPWVYDGINEPVMIQDVTISPKSSEPKIFTVVNGYLFFEADDGSGKGRELWLSDGTESGTNMIKDIYSGSSNSEIDYMTMMGWRFYFKAKDGNGSELWISDGTELGTKMLKDINPSSDSNPEYLTVMDEKLYFSADDGTNGTELWVSDGTEAGTIMLKDIHLTLSSTPKNFTVMNDKLYFRANDGPHDEELWVSDGTEAGTTMLKDINPIGNSNSQYYTVVNNKLFFSAFDLNGSELWVTDGTKVGTKMVKDINPNAAFSEPSYLTRVNGKLFFSANDGTNGYELWISDGTEAGTKMVKDINIGGDSSPYRFIAMDDKLYFAADDGTNGYELWVSDGTEAGTKMVKNINPNGGADIGEYLRVVNGKLYFVADDGSNGKELWVTDGTEAGTKIASNINPGDSSSDPQYITVLVSNANPTNITLSSNTLAENSATGTVIGTLSATDADSSDTATFTFGCTVVGTNDGNFTIEGNTLKSNYEFDYEATTSQAICIRVTDSGNAVFDKNITINITNINEVPTWSMENNSTYEEVNLDINLSNYIFDQDNSSFTFNAITSTPALGLVTIEENILKVTPIENKSGVMELTIYAYDGDNNISKDINITINEVNDAPTINTIFSNQTFDEDNGTIPFELNVSDIDGDDLNITVESNNTNILTISKGWNGLLSQGYYDSVALDFNITTIENANGTVKITIKADDNNLSHTKTFDINVSAINDTPVLQSISDINKSENFPEFNITLNGSDIDNTNLTYSVDSNDSSLVDLNITNNILTINLKEDMYGIVSIDVNLSDGEV